MTLVLLVLFFVSLWLALVWCPTWAPRLQGWLEAASGANWPSDWSVLLNGPSGRWFAPVLAARMTAGIAGAIGAATAALWFLFGGLEKLIMHVSRRELAQMFNAVLTPALADLLEARKPQLKLDVDDRAAMLAKADELADKYEHNLNQHYPPRNDFG